MTTMDFGDGLAWRKATASGGDNGGCLFVARHPDTGMVGVRDSKHPTDPPQWYTQTEWSAFLTGVHAGEFDTV